MCMCIDALLKIIVWNIYKLRFCGRKILGIENALDWKFPGKMQALTLFNFGPL